MIWTCKHCGFVADIDTFPVTCVCGHGSDEDVAMPATVTRIKNYLKAAVHHVRTGSVTCSDQEIADRLEVCSGCEFFDGKACGKCGCRVNSTRFLNKLAWADQDCPVGKWPVSLSDPDRADHMAQAKRLSRSSHRVDREILPDIEMDLPGNQWELITRPQRDGLPMQDHLCVDPGGRL